MRLPTIGFFAALCLTSLTQAQSTETSVSDTLDNARQPLTAIGEPTKYTPISDYFYARLTGRVQHHGPVVVDNAGSTFRPDLSINTQFRTGAVYDSARKIKSVRLRLEYEHDFLIGPIRGGQSNVDGVFMPDNARYDDQQIRKLNLTMNFGRYLTVSAGFTTSHWGLGLLANDGAHGWAPGNGRFSDPRGGDVVLRALLATGPHTDESLIIFGAVDMPWDDDLMLDGDEAFQVIGGFKVGTGTRYEAGLYGVYRSQDASDGQRTEVGVIDLYGKYVHPLGDATFELEMEGALIFGSTELAPSSDFPTHDVLQLGFGVRAGYHAPLGGAVLDFLYASGDRNLDDNAQNAFGVDPNYDMGMLLFRQVLTAQSGRSAVTAADPDLVGVPNEDLDRFPTRQRLMNTIAIFPRGYIRPIDGLEIFAGVLAAFTEVDNLDPLNTRTFGGGDARNALGSDPGTYYGTEIDLGIRQQALLWGTQLTVGVEGAVFIPGNAITGENGLGGDPIWGGRLTLTYEL